MGKKKLAYSYERGKTKIGEGWYALFTYTGLPEIIPKLESIMRVEDVVLKFLTVKRDPKEIDTGEELYENTLDQDQVISEQDDCHTVAQTQDYFDLIFDIKEVM